MMRLLEKLRNRLYAHRHHAAVAKRHIAAYSPYDIGVYRHLLAQASQRKQLVLAPFLAPTAKSRQYARFFVRHDIDTLACIHNMNALLQIDLEFELQAGVYFRVDDQEYRLSEHRGQIETLRTAGFEVGLHTVCYLENDFLGAFQRETEKFVREAGFQPHSFTVHGLGDFRLETRLQFCDQIVERLHEYGYSFSDCHPRLRQYTYVIEDCHREPGTENRFIYDDFVTLPRWLQNQRAYLVLTHPCYWAA